jgi:hypothetical protein
MGMVVMLMVVLVVMVVMPIAMAVVAVLVVMTGITGCMPMELIFVVNLRIVPGLFLGLQFSQPVALEQAHAQQQTQRHIPAAGPQDAGIRFDRP